MDKLLDAIGGNYQTVDSAPRRAAAVQDPTGAGATAQTGGFVGTDANVNAGAGAGTGSSGFAAGIAALVGGTGGGLASSPNVPRPGATIDPATGQPHTAGLTRAELEAQRSLKGKERDPAEVSGREQAARQLAGGAATVGTAQTIREGENRSIAHASTFSDELKTGVKELQDAVSPYIPQTIKGVFGSPPASPKTASTTTVPGEQRRGSFAALYSQVKTESGKIVHNLQERMDNIDPISSTWGSMIPEAATGPVRGNAGIAPGAAGVSTTSATTTAAPTLASTSGASATAPSTTTTAVGPDGSRRGSIAGMLDSVKVQGNKLVHDIQAQLDTTKQGTLGSNVAHVGDNVKGFFNEMLEGTDKQGEAPILTFNDRGAGASGSAALTGATAAAMSAGFAGVGQESATLLATKHQLPPTVPVIAGGNGAGSGLAGTATGNKSLPSQENQGMLPGEVSMGAGALPGKNTEPGVALLPDEKKAEGTAGGLQTSTGLGTTAGSSTTGSGAGLAAPLPATVLGQGAAKGATDIEATHGVNAASAIPATNQFASTGSNPSTVGSGLVPPTAGDRTTSMSSVTAIKGGHVGDRSETKGGLVGVAAAGAAAAGAAGATAGATGPQSTANGSHALKDSAPGAAHEAVGHPSAVGADVAGTTRDVGTYPQAQHDGPAHDSVVPSASKNTAATSGVTTTGADANVPGAGSSGAVPNGTAPPGLPTGGDGIGAEIPPSKDGEAVVPPGIETGRPAKWTEALHNPNKDPEHETAAAAAATPVSPSTATTATNGNGAASARKSIDDKAHGRKSSGGGGSEKRKSGLFAKIKDKLSHHDN